MASFIAEVIADSSGKWCGNALRFATERAAERYVSDLAWRWTAVRDTRVVPSDDVPTLDSATVAKYEAATQEENLIADTF